MDAATGGTTRIGGITTFKCGDGEVNPGEVCDQGQYQGSPGCAADCKTQDPDYVCYPSQQCFRSNTCGNGRVESEWGEQCEPASANDRDCTADCVLRGYCGDGVANSSTGEECDYGTDANSGGYDGCTPNCLLGPHCGDGLTSSPEQCDFGTGLNLGEYGGCAPSCNLGPYCGDGITNGPEQCDLGTDLNLGEYGGCTPNCKLGPHCGDGVLNGPEECDDGSGTKGNGSAYSRCTATCKNYVYL